MKSKFHLHGLVLSREQTQLQMYMTFIIMRTPTTDTWQIRMKEYFKLSFLYNLESSNQNHLSLPHLGVFFPPTYSAQIVSNNPQTSLSGTTWGFEHLSYDQGAQLPHHVVGKKIMHKKSFSSFLSLLCALHSCICHYSTSAMIAKGRNLNCG